METPPPPKRVSAGLPRRVLDVSMREFPSLFAGYKNVTHELGIAERFSTDPLETGALKQLGLSSIAEQP